MDIVVVGDIGLDRVEEGAEFARAVAGEQRPMILPVAVSRAANSDSVPWRV